MAEHGETPVFGSRVEGCPYIVRPSAYALVRNAGGEIAVVRTRRGLYLPGGGVENGESPPEAAAREAREECGLVLVPLRVLGAAVEIVHSAKKNACFEKRSTFLDAHLQGHAPAGEPDHELAWLTPAEAMTSLSLGSHRWAVQRLALLSAQETPP